MHGINSESLRGTKPKFGFRLLKRLRFMANYCKYRSLPRWIVVVIARMGNRTWNRFSKSYSALCVKELAVKPIASNVGFLTFTKPKLVRDRTIPIHMPVGFKVSTEPGVGISYIMRGFLVFQRRKVFQSILEETLDSIPLHMQGRVTERLGFLRDAGLSDTDIFAMLREDLELIKRDQEYLGDHANLQVW